MGWERRRSSRENTMSAHGFEARAAGVSDREYRANRTAQFLPMSGPETALTLPAVKVAGAVVFVYVKAGKLRVSVDLDEAGEFFPDPVPLEVAVQGTTVFTGEGLAAHFDADQVEALIRTAGECWAYAWDAGMREVATAVQEQLAERAWQLMEAEGPSG